MEKTEDRSLFSVVVSGHMNPAIHHPAWYEQIGILTQAEALESLKGENFVCLPQVAQFASRGITVTCIPTRWDARTTKADQRERILDIAKRTYTALDHTPVSAFGFNFDIVEDAEAEDDIARYFGASLLPSIGLEGDWRAT